MTDRRTDAPVREQVAAVVSSVVADVFTAVEQVRDLVLDLHATGRRRGDGLHEADLSALGEPLQGLLETDRAAIGMGVILAPGLLPERSLRLEWWQSEADRDEPTRLEVDLNADSLNFYDYAAAEWFVVPRQTGRRHVAGPYVDVHGTDRYLLTFTEPVLADGVFLGVAGADVPVARFETLVLRGLSAELSAEVVLTSREGRVVFSSTARRLPGELLPAGAREDTEWSALPGLPWLLAAGDTIRL